jgi:hypothetical protein
VRTSARTAIKTQVPPTGKAVPSILRHRFAHPTATLNAAAAAAALAGPHGEPWQKARRVGPLASPLHAEAASRVSE